MVTWDLSTSSRTLLSCNLSANGEMTSVEGVLPQETYFSPNLYPSLDTNRLNNQLYSELAVLPYVPTEQQINDWFTLKAPLPPILGATLQWGTGGVRAARSVTL